MLAVCCGVQCRRTAVVELDVVHRVTSSDDGVVGSVISDDGGGGATVSLLMSRGGLGDVVVAAGLRVVGFGLDVDDDGAAATSSS